MHAILFTRESRNGKTGPIPVTTTSKESCPTDCAFRGAGCYAEAGPLGALWRGMSAAGPDSQFSNGRGTVRTIGWDGLLREIKALPPGTLWRHNQAGDLPSDGSRIRAADLKRLASANRGRKGFTYTHHNVLQDARNRDAVADANRRGFTVNLSGNTLAHADRLADLSIAPVVVVLPASAAENTTTPAGRKVVICPAVQRNDVTCASCGLCARQRDFIVGFPAHGASKRRVEAIATEGV
jgi:hypothetical protein